MIVIDEGVRADEFAALAGDLMAAGYSWVSIELGNRPTRFFTSPSPERTSDARIETLSIDGAGSVIGDGQQLPSTWSELREALALYEPLPVDVEPKPVLKIDCLPDSPARLLARLIALGHGERRFWIELEMGDEEVRIPAMEWSKKTEPGERRPPYLTLSLGRYAEALIAAFGFRPHPASTLKPDDPSSIVEDVRSTARDLLFEPGHQETILIVNEHVRAQEIAVLISDADEKGYPVVSIEPGGRWPKEGAPAIDASAARK